MTTGASSARALSKRLQAAVVAEGRPVAVAEAFVRERSRVRMIARFIETSRRAGQAPGIEVFAERLRVIGLDE
jgi:hypothetical protein